MINDIYDIQSLHAFEVTYQGPTNFRGSKVRIKSLRYSDTDFNGRRKVDVATISYDYPGDHRYDGATQLKNAAVTWLRDHGFNVVAVAESTNSFIVLSDTFTSIRDARKAKA